MDITEVRVKLMEDSDDRLRAFCSITFDNAFVVRDLKIIEGTIANVPPQGGRKHPHQEFISINTTNILFICGGAFDGLDKIVERRIGNKLLGFGADIKSRKEEAGENELRHLIPEDLIKYGLIPEFVGRLPVLATLDDLDRAALIEILTRPRNAITKQYEKLFELENVTLRFTGEVLGAIADLAMRRKSGARGLRAILEEIMLDVMYDLPSSSDVEECLISEDVVTKGAMEAERRKGNQRVIGAYDILERLVPENQPWMQHTLEGADDSSSHLRAGLLPTSLSIPIENGRLALGQWQGIYLVEHRSHGHLRQVRLDVLIFRSSGG